jgi:hypothetical protein
MPKTIEVPELGQLSFPDEATDDQIEHSVNQALLEHQQQQERTKGKFTDAMLGAADYAEQFVQATADTPTTMLNTPGKIADTISKPLGGPRFPDIAQPGVPLVNIPAANPQQLADAIDVLSHPPMDLLTGKAGTPSRRPSGVEKVISGLNQAGAETLSGFTTPEMLTALPAGAAPKVAAMFGAQMAQHLPEQVGVAAEAAGNSDMPLDERTKAIAQPAIAGAMIGSIAKHQNADPRSKFAGILANREVNPSPTTVATEQKQTDYDRYQELVADMKGAGPDEQFSIAQEIEAIKNKNGGMVPKPPTFDAVSPLEPEHQALVTENLDATNGAGVRVISAEEANGENAPFAGGIRWLAVPDFKTGQVLLNGPEFSRWLSGIPEADRPKAVRAVLSEESIHLATPEAAADAYAKNMTGVERWAVNKRYGTGNHNLEGRNLGYEAIRFRLQQAMKMTPTEYVNALRGDRSMAAMKTLTMLESTVRGIRENLLKTKASAESLAMLSKVTDNINNAKFVLGGGNPAALSGEQANQTAKDLQKEAELYRKLGDEESAKEMEDMALWIQQKADQQNMRGGQFGPNAASAELFGDTGPSKKKSESEAERYKKLTGKEPSSGFIQRSNAGRPAAEKVSVFDKKQPVLWTKDGAPITASTLEKPENFTRADAEKAGLEYAPRTAEAIDKAALDVISFEMEKASEAYTPGGNAAGSEVRMPTFEDFSRKMRQRNPELEHDQLLPAFSSALGKALRNSSDNMLMALMRAERGEPEKGGGTFLPSGDIVASKMTQDIARLTPEQRRELQQQFLTPEEAKTAQQQDEARLRLTAAVDKLDFTGAEAKRKAAEDAAVAKMTIPERDAYFKDKERRLSATRILMEGEKEKTREVSPAAVRRQDEEFARRIKRNRTRVISDLFKASIKKAMQLDDGMLHRKSVTSDEIQQGGYSFIDSRGDRVVMPSYQALDPNGIGGFTIDALTRKNRRSSRDDWRTTKKVAAIQDKQTGAVHLVSVFEHPRGQHDIRFTDPRIPQGESGIPFGPELFNRYRLLYSMLLDEPVRNFHQEFDDLHDYNAKFGDDAQRHTVSGEGRYVETSAEDVEAEKTGFRPNSKFQQSFMPDPSDPRKSISVWTDPISGEVLERDDNPRTVGEAAGWAGEGEQYEQPIEYQHIEGLPTTQAESSSSFMGPHADTVRDRAANARSKYSIGNITQSQAEALHEYLRFKRKHEVIDAIRQLSGTSHPRKHGALAAVVKASKQIAKDNPNLGADELLERTANKIELFYNSAEKVSDFGKMLGVEQAKESLSGEPAPPGKELLMPLDRRAPTDVREENLPPGYKMPDYKPATIVSQAAPEPAGGRYLSFEDAIQVLFRVERAIESGEVAAESAPTQAIRNQAKPSGKPVVQYPKLKFEERGGARYLVGEEAPKPVGQQKFELPAAMSGEKRNLSERDIPENLKSALLEYEFGFSSGGMAAHNEWAKSVEDIAPGGSVSFSDILKKFASKPASEWDFNGKTKAMLVSFFGSSKNSNYDRGFLARAQIKELKRELDLELKDLKYSGEQISGNGGKFEGLYQSMIERGMKRISSIKKDISDAEKVISQEENITVPAHRQQNLPFAASGEARDILQSGQARILNGLSTYFSSKQNKENIPKLKDAADTIANNAGMAAERSVLAEQVNQFAVLQRAVGAAAKGNIKESLDTITNYLKLKKENLRIREAAMAVIHAGGWKNIYKYDTKALEKMSQLRRDSPDFQLADRLMAGDLAGAKNELLNRIKEKVDEDETGVSKWQKMLTLINQIPEKLAAEHNELKQEVADREMAKAAAEDGLPIEETGGKLHQGREPYAAELKDHLLMVGKGLFEASMRNLERQLVNEGFLSHKDVTREFQPKAKAKLDGFLKQLAEAEKDARAIIGRGNLADSVVQKARLKEIESLRNGVEFAKAHWGDDKMNRVAERAKKEFDDQFDREKENGVQVSYNENFIPGRYDAEFFNNDAVQFRGKLMLGGNFSESKSFKNHYDAIQAGPYIALTHDIASLVGHRVRAGAKRIEGKAFIESLKGMYDEEMAAPIAVGVKQAPDGGYIADAPKGVSRALYEIRSEKGGAKPKIAVLKGGYERIINRMLNPSWFEDNGAASALLQVHALLKHTTLMADFFHLARIGYYSLASARFNPTKMNWRKGLSVLDYRLEDLDRAAASGMLDPRTVAWAKEKIPVNLGGSKGMMTRHEVSQMLQRQGYNVGQISDAIYKDVVNELPKLLGIIPGVSGEAMAKFSKSTLGRYNKFLFDEWQRGLMGSRGLEEFERLQKLDPDKDSNVIARGVAKDLNKLYGNIGSQGWVQSKTARDLTRILFLAPQWAEGIIKKDASLAKLVTSPREVLTGRESLAAPIAMGFVMMFALTQTLSMIQNGRPTWKNEDKKHHLDWQVSKNLYVSPMSVYNEAIHDLVRYGETKPKAWDAITQIGENKLGFYSRAGLVLGSGESPTGERITTTLGVWKEAAKQLIPMPITVSKPARAIGNAIAPNLVSPNAEGDMMKQLLATGGIKAEYARTAVKQMSDSARKFIKDNNLPTRGDNYVPTDEASYSKLRRAIDLGDAAQAKRMLAELRKTRTDQQILKEMTQWAKKGFTGSNANERLWLHSLSDDELRIYEAAINQKYDLLQKWEQFYVNQ